MFSNFSGTGIPLLGYLLQGKFQDFNSEWFFTVGAQLSSIVIFFILKIVIFFLKTFIIRGIKRSYDRSVCCCCCRKKNPRHPTRKKTIQEYVDLYGGWIFYIEYQYTNIMKIVFITLMLGTGIPMLFFFCSLNFLIIYAVEKYNFAYNYKRPPMYNNLISEDTLIWLRWGFLLHMLFGFWMISSTGLYHNTKHAPPQIGGFYGGHSLLAFVIPNVGWPMSIAAIAFMCYQFYPGKIFNVKTSDKAEGFDKYSNSIQNYDRQNIVKEET